MNDDTAPAARRPSRRGNENLVSESSANLMGPQPALSIAVLLDLGMSRRAIASYFQVHIEHLQALEAPTMADGQAHPKDTPADR